MRIAPRAQHFRPQFCECMVFAGSNVLRGDGRGKAGPTGTGIELLLRTEKRRGATDASVEPGAMLIPQFVGEGKFGAGLPCYVVDFGEQLRAPLGVSL